MGIIKNMCLVAYQVIQNFILFELSITKFIFIIILLIKKLITNIKN